MICQLVAVLVMVAGPTLDPAADFEPGLAKGASSLEVAREDPR
jgi:hypothetical protein